MYITVLSYKVINEYPDWSKWPKEEDAVFRVMYNRFSDMETGLVD